MNAEELQLLIKEADDIGQVPLIEGLHGIGKTESVGQYARSADIHLEPLILSLMDTGDLLGIPDTIVMGGIKSTVWAAPDWYVNVVNYAWPNNIDGSALVFNDKDLEKYFTSEGLIYKPYLTRTDVNKAYQDFYSLPEGYLHILAQDNLMYSKGKRSVVFLDEINRSAPDIQDASLQLILEKRLHSHILPRVMGKDTLIVGAINPSGKQYNVSEFDPALLDRFVFATLDIDLPTWTKWARSNGIEEVIIDFLTSHTSRFHFTPEEGKGTSPRSWVKMSDYVTSIKDSNTTGFSNYAIGRLGLAVGVEFTTFYDNYKSTITVENLDKSICAALRRKGANANVQEVSKELVELISKLDQTQMIEYTEYFKNHYLVDEVKKTKPLLVFLYALPLEVLSTVLKENKKDILNHRMLDKADRELNGSELFLKLTRNLRNDN